MDVRKQGGKELSSALDAHEIGMLWVQKPMSIT